MNNGINYMQKERSEFWKIICGFLLPKFKCFSEKVYGFQSIQHHRNFKNILTLEKKIQKYHDLINQEILDFSNINNIENKIKNSIKIENQRIIFDKVNFNIDDFPKAYIPVISNVLKTYQFLFNKKIIEIDNTKNIHFHKFNKKEESKNTPLSELSPQKIVKNNNFKIHWLGFEINLTPQDIDKLFKFNFSYDQKQDILNNIFGLPQFYFPIIEKNKELIKEKSFINKGLNHKKRKSLKIFIDWTGDFYLI